MELGVIGKMTGADAEAAIPKPFGDDDIRYRYDLGEGSTMDMGCEHRRILCGAPKLAN